jgi:hypothetical protein
MTEEKKSLESELADSNEFYFLREFTFSSTKFKVEKQELELADSLICIDDSAIVFQLKERNAQGGSQDDDSWYENKVIKKGTKQIRDTHTYLSANEFIKLKNHRNHEITISKSNLNSIINLIVFRSSGKLSPELNNKKYYLSSSVGVIHTMSFDNYKKILGILLTFAELEEYLKFRNEVIEKWGEKINFVTEESLLGQFIALADPQIEPSVGYENYLPHISHQVESWDMTGILHVFFERMYDVGDHYKIVAELAKLKRSELKEIKTRFTISMERAFQNKISPPLRVMVPRTGCCFVFVPVPQELRDRRRFGLEVFTKLNKYSFKAYKSVGACFVGEENGHFLVDWAYLEEPWQFNQDTEQMLKDAPFLSVKAHEVPRYHFNASVQALEAERKPR